MGKPKIFRDPMSKETVRRLADETFGDMIKFIVDVEQKIICAGGGLHSDEEKLLLEDGCLQNNLWGANYYPDLPGEDRFEYQSLINIRPSQTNRKQQIESKKIRDRVRELAIHFFEAT
jgi:hypothetical protein